MKDEQDFLSYVQDYYREAFEKYGPTPKGVDWNGAESQSLRFQVQYDLVQKHLSKESRVLDYGCGYGEFANFLIENEYLGAYTGVDLVSESISIAKMNFFAKENFTFVNKLSESSWFDLIFASGVFNVYPGDAQMWLNLHIRSCLLEMSKHSDVIVVNFLKSNPSRPVSNLFFPTQVEIKSVLPDNFHISDLSDDYGLWEWTAVLMRRELT